MTKKIIGAKYIGKRSYLRGVPARDLTKEEWMKLPAKKRKHLEKVLKLYEVNYAM
jgi:hypothetical protein